MFLAPIQQSRSSAATGLPALLDQLAQTSTRPRYAFMLLGLIAELAGPDGSAGPIVLCNGASTLLRDWLCDALTPMGCRDPKRKALAAQIRDELERTFRLPADPAAAQALVEDEIRERVRSSGKTNLSRAITELVKAGLLGRHYQGTFVDHRNRGAQRHVVYTLAGSALCLLHQAKPAMSPQLRCQDELPLPTPNSSHRYPGSGIYPSALPG